MTDAATLKKGVAWYEYVMARKRPDLPASPLQEIGSLEFCFANTWSRPGLDIRARRFVTLATVWSVGAVHPTRVHMHAALKSGDISYEEMREAILQFAVYAGMPAASALEGYLEEIWAEVQAEGGPVKLAPPKD